ncbi:MAG: hypothetical protein ACYCYA_14580, partial [Actinomycetes bacterium]
MIMRVATLIHGSRLRACQGVRVDRSFPVSPLLVPATVVVPASVVDLQYRTTLDRFAYTQRLSCASEPARRAGGDVGGRHRAEQGAGHRARR